MTQDRTPYAPPPNEKEWANAQRDYLAGRVLGLRWHHRAATVELRVTATWHRHWRALVHGAQARADIRAACLHVARGRVHPALGVHPVPASLGEGMMASPSAGWTVTWRMDGDVPVFLTLTYDDDLT